MQNNVTIKDIADSLNISKASVSYVLNDKNSNVKIGDLTKRRIFQTAWDMRYKVRDNIIINVPILNNTTPFYLDLFVAASGKLLEMGFSSTINISGHNADRVGATIDSIFRDRSARGIIFVEYLPEELEKTLLAKRVPYLVLNPLKESPINRVECDDGTGVRILLDDCLMRGYRRMPFLSKKEIYYDVPWHKKRKAMYLNFCREKNIEAEFFEPQPLEIKNVIDEIINRNEKQVLISNLPSNLEFLLRMKFFQKKYPEDIAYVTISHTVYEALQFNLTRLNIPLEEMGYKGAEMIAKMIESEVNTLPTEYCVPKLINRGSC